MIQGVRELKSSRYHKTQNRKNFCQKCWKRMWVRKSKISFLQCFKSKLFERNEPCSLNSAVMNKLTTSFGKTLKVFWWDVVLWLAEGQSLEERENCFPLLVTLVQKGQCKGHQIGLFWLLVYCFTDAMSGLCVFLATVLSGLILFSGGRIHWEFVIRA